MSDSNNMLFLSSSLANFCMENFKCEITHAIKIEGKGKGRDLCSCKFSLEKTLASSLGKP